ncbi:MAG: cob(I)yrinic acid a,c-diamide adenosyltransferase [Lewinella sp.]|nr:cob(I)yrinic acid a,c-diamide adenosyltransferase [Lewinella sp.]
MKIYTKTGDEGQTGLFSGRRLSKADLRVEAYGTLDELNATLGLLRDHLTEETTRALLLRQQHLLFDLGALLADDRTEAQHYFPAEAALGLEAEMDRLTALLPPLRHFVLPGGHPHVSFAHLVRTVCRRAERRVVALVDSGEALPTAALVYLNRLSDYAFVLARYLALANGTEELKWEANGSA